MDASNKESKLSNTTPSFPFDHDLILKLVLKHVGIADVDDLKNCRLVCHSWNKVAVQVLEQQHGCAIELDCKKMVDYKALLWYTQFPQMNSTEYRDPLASLRLSLNMLPLSNSENLSEAAKWVQLLMIYPHLRIAFLDCTYRIQTEKDHLSLANLELFNLLKLASSHLTSITIFAHICADDVPYFEEFHFECYGSIEFPKLSSIHYKVHNQNGMPGVTKHLAELIHRAPKLTELNLDVCESNEEKRCGKSLDRIMEGCAVHLEKLEITERFEGQIMKILKKTNFPKLKTLEMKNNVTCSCNDFIQFCNECPALSHIDFLWFSVDIVEDNLNIAQFPTLANIKHLGLYPYHRTLPEELEQIRWNFATKLTKFPCLNSMGISLGVLFMLGAHLKNSGHLVPPLDQYPAFANVSSAVIHLVFSSRPMFNLVDMAEQIYNHSFPHLRKLVINVDIYSIELYKQKICPTIEFLCRRPGLEVLEIHNYAHDWLGQIPKDIQILQGLNSLKLVPPSTTTTAVDDNGCGSPLSPQINIMDFLTRFPVLERLQFGKETLCRTEIQAIRSGMNSISRFEKATHRRK